MAPAGILLVAAVVLALAAAGEARFNVLFLGVDDFRDEAQFLSPGLVGPGCSLDEHGGCSQVGSTTCSR